MADFHAADLWVAVVPDVSKVGPAMEQAGKDAKGKFGAGVKDFGKTIHDDLDKISTKAKESFSKITKDISEGFGKAGKDSAEKFNKGISDDTKGKFSDLGKSLGGELGKALGDALADRIPAISQVRAGFDGIREAIGQIKEGNLGAAFADWNRTLDQVAPLIDHIGIDIRGWKVPDGVIKDVNDLAVTGLAAKEAFVLARSAIIALGGAEVLAAVGSLSFALGPIAVTVAAIALAAKQIHDIMSIPMSADTSVPNLNIQNQGPTPPGGFPAPPKFPTPQPPAALPPLFAWDKPGHQFGGPISGPGAYGKDSVFMMGAPGEHVITAAEVAAAGGHQNVYAARALMRAGFFKNMRGLQGGGEVGDAGSTSGSGNLANLYRYAQSIVGTPYSQDARTDCSGMAAKLINVALGLPPSASFTTQTEQPWLLQHGFKMGAGPPGSLRVGWYNHGSGADDGHTAVTLPDGTNAESGGAHGAFLLGAGAKGASGFEMQAYLPMNPQGTAISSSGGPAGGGAGGGGGFGAPGGGGGLVGGAGAGGGGGGGEELGQQLGAGIVSGGLEALGLDGSVFKSFTGKGPMDWGITKLGTGLLNWGLGGFGTGKPLIGGAGGMPGGMGGGIGQGILGAVGVNMPGGGAGGPGGGDVHNHYAPQNQTNVTQNGVNDGVQAWQQQQNAAGGPGGGTPAPAPMTMSPAAAPT